MNTANQAQRENPHRPGNQGCTNRAMGLWDSSRQPCGPVTRRLPDRVDSVMSVMSPMVESSVGCRLEGWGGASLS